MDPLNNSVLPVKIEICADCATAFSNAVVFLLLQRPLSEVFVAIPRLSSYCRRNLGVHAPQIPAGQHQICQAEQREQLRVVLGQTAVARFTMFEQALHDMEAMLNLGAHAGLSSRAFRSRGPAGSS